MSFERSIINWQVQERLLSMQIEKLQHELEAQGEYLDSQKQAELENLQRKKQNLGPNPLAKMG